MSDLLNQIVLCEMGAECISMIHNINRECVHSVDVYQSKTTNEVGKIDAFRAWARKLSFLPTELDIFYIRQHQVRILFIFRRIINLLSFVIFNSDKTCI